MQVDVRGASPDVSMNLRPIASLAALVACARADMNRAHNRRPQSAAANRICATPPRGIVVSRDSIASLPTHATLGEIKRRCDAGDTTLYDAVGWQAAAWVFPFEGARVVVVQTKRGDGDVVRDDEVPDLWTVEGDSVRLPDGQLMPRTLGVLRARFAPLVVDENIPADDVDGPHARSCRLPYLLFALAVNDTARRVPDSARVTRVDLDGVDSLPRHLCSDRSAESR
jgi:hypothetical protein